MAHPRDSSLRLVVFGRGPSISAPICALHEGLCGAPPTSYRWRKVRGGQGCIGPRAPRISHMFFADDSYLFLIGSLQECKNLIEVQNEYEELSGQKVNLTKSAVCFSKNVSLPNQDFLAEILGLRAVGVQDKYLGLPMLIVQSKMATFRFLEEKLLSRLQGWKQGILSWAAKETLIKSVALALPLHIMS
ncbi:unnamed protein product [Linum trigynum]|uniref:Reverse transcriptase domain-containing protein n=1 Tax=Linum trigynum TaxID=586398 RepID=A0AAV2E9E4_9ROSI